jgi:hypothetical protein
MAPDDRLDGTSASGHPATDVVTGSAVSTLQAVLDWPADWDGQGAQPPSHKAVVKALVFLWMVESRFRDERVAVGEPWLVTPLPNGNVFIEWHGPDDDTLDLEIRPDDTVGYLLVRHDGGERHFEEQERATTTDALDALSRLFRVR